MTHIPAAFPNNLEPAGQWLKRGPCREDPDAMYPSSNAAEIETAKAICRRCSVTERCLQWALETGEAWGVWGGLSEEERRSMKSRAARVISIDDYTGTPRTHLPTAGRTFQQIWEDCTQEEGEHVLWTGPRTVHQAAGPITSNRLSFYLDRGHWPDGDVKRTCKTDRCVRPAHLADKAERDEEADLKVSA